MPNCYNFYREEVRAVGMTDRQFDAFLAQVILNLKNALEETPDNKKLQAYIEHLEASLQRP